MLTKPLAEIGLAELNALLGVAQESKTLEFKRELAPGNKGDMTLLAGISALANTAGGDFLIGITAKEGVADALPGVAILNLDAEKLRLENLIGSCVEPRLPRLDLHPIAVGADRYVLLIRVPFSWNGPHRVTKDNRFYGRTSAGIYPLDVGELRSAFNLGEGIAERIRAFRTERLVRIAAGDTPVPLSGSAAVVLHLVPLPPIASRQSLDVVSALEAGHHFPLPLGSSGNHNQPGVNLDGLFSSYSTEAGTARGYVQIFRNGAIEGVNAMNADANGAYIADMPFGNMVVGAAKQYLAVLNDLNLGFPVFAMLSLVSPAGCRMRYGTEFGGGWYDTPPLRGPVSAFPEAVFDSIRADVPALLRPVLNVAWNAFGIGKCSMYNGQGGWKGTA